MSELIPRLRDEAARLVEATDRSPIGALFDGTATKELYVAFLQETWHYVRFTSGTLLLAGEAEQARRAQLAVGRADREGEEEKGHDLWALADLAALGVGERQVRPPAQAFRSPPTTPGPGLLPRAHFPSPISASPTLWKILRCSRPAKRRTRCGRLPAFPTLPMRSTIWWAMAKPTSAMSPARDRAGAGEEPSRT